MPGFVLSIIIGIISMLLSKIHPSLDSLVISIILGMLVGNFFEKKHVFESGINICVKVCLPAGIILYGSQLVIHLSNPSHLLIVPLIFAVSFSFTFLISRLFKLREPFAILLGSGLAVCGASAITVLSPLLGAKKEETSLSIISVMVIGLIGLIVYPLILSGLEPDVESYALFTGTTLPMLGQVKVVGGMENGEILEKAVNYKLLRVSMLMFLIVWFGLLKKEKRVTEGSIIFPYIVRLLLIGGFIFMVLLSNLLDGAGLRNFLEPVSRFFLTVTLAAIGLSVDFDSITEIGPRPLYGVAISWILVCLFVYIVGTYV